MLASLKEKSSTILQGMVDFCRPELAQGIATRQNLPMQT
jgi:hypothetical protein